ncbi:MAG: Twin-arginine translocation pathway signal [Rhodospirillaceae bacterium]|nr:Twin-arginine translocation pathway signal [Rhodospirillaceae bacterium]
MKGKSINRRQFLQTSGYAVAGAAAIGSGAVVIAADGAWALSTTTLDQHAAMTLLRVSRMLFPHDFLGDQYYAKVVEALDAQAANDPAMATQIRDGIAALDSTRDGIAFLDLSDGYAEDAIGSIEGTPFFGTMRGATINNLYGNPLVWRFFGYEGSSWQQGGYLHRGFDDAGWLDAIIESEA